MKTYQTGSPPPTFGFGASTVVVCVTDYFFIDGTYSKNTLCNSKLTWSSTTPCTSMTISKEIDTIRILDFAIRKWIKIVKHFLGQSIWNWKFLLCQNLGYDCSNSPFPSFKNPKYISIRNYTKIYSKLVFFLNLFVKKLRKQSVYICIKSLNFLRIILFNKIDTDLLTQVNNSVVAIENLIFYVFFSI